MRKYFLLSLFTVGMMNLTYAQLGLFNTRTLYDSFENPAQKAFYADSSRKIAFNFFIPTISVNAAVTGEVQDPLRNLLYGGGELDTRDLTLGGNKSNKVLVTENSYVLMLRIFKTVKYHREIGFAWQVRSDTYGDVTNESIAIFQNFKQFASQSYEDPFNSRANNINFHQFSFNYREDYNKRLGLGIKLSYLSGITHNQLKIKSSTLDINPSINSYSLSLNGIYRSNISFDEAQDKIFRPGFRNPGLAASLSAAYKLRGGWNILGNVKDLGFIKWNKKHAYTYSFNDNITVTAPTSSEAREELTTEIEELFDKGSSIKSYITPINTKAEFLISKDFDWYKPHLFISKNVFNPGGEVVLVNRLSHRALNFSLSTGYNLNNYVQVGGQFMIKSPNAEFFLGSDQLFQTIYTTKGIIGQDETFNKGKTAASIYLGFGLKFGQFMQRRQNATMIPGIDRDSNPSFFQRILRQKD